MCKIGDCMKKLDNRGFAISTLLYGLMIMSLLIVLALISNLGTNRKSTSTFVDKIEDELNRLNLTNTGGEYGGGEADENGHEFIATSAGWYKIELWGAGGGGNKGGRGAYVSGIIYLEENDHLYFYYGEKGGKTKAFNGGGTGSTQNSNYFAGGGATDVRLISGEWNEESSLESRIMVAAGGGGTGYGASGGFGGTLVGGNGAISSPSASDPTISYGGLQSAGGKNGEGSNESGEAGSFGTGGAGGKYLAGGGGGYYGGGASGVTSTVGGGGAGGSSFIAGFAGVQVRNDGEAVKQTSKEFTIHRGQYDENGELVTEQYTPVIYNGIMIPNVNSDVGKSQITKVSGNDISNPPRKGSNAKLKDVKYIRDCVDGNTVDNNGYWLEIQAIKDGKNLAAQEGVTVSGTGGTLEEGSVIIDGVMDDTSSVASISGGGQKCVQVQLTSAEDLDEIAVWHQYGKSNMSFKGHTLSVSTDGSNWRVVRDKSTDTNSAGVVNEVESASGIRYNTFHGDSLGEIPEGNYYIFSANSDNMVLSSYTENDNTFARMSDFTGKSNQIWRVYKSNGVYRIVNTSSNMALEVSEDSGEAGVLIDLYTNNVNDTSQNWNIASLKNGYYTITSSNGLRMGYNTSSTATETQTSTQEKEQRWKFVWADY